MHNRWLILVKVAAMAQKAIHCAESFIR